MTSIIPPEIYHNNMGALKERFPDLYEKAAACGKAPVFPFEVVQTSYGQINIAATLSDGSNVLFYEGEDIIDTLKQQLTQWQLRHEDFLFCVGMGLGYLPWLASGYFETRPRIVVIEPDPKILALAMATSDLRGLLAYEGFDLFLGPDLPVADIIRSYGESIFFGKNQLVSHTPSRLISPETFTALEKEVVDNIRVARNIGFTVKHAGQKIFSNTIQNIPNLFCGPDLKSLEGRFKGCPAICVAAGPSLDQDLAALKSFGHRALILCADSAVRSLANEGIAPHIVVTTDMNAANFDKLRTSIHLLRDTVLVFSIEANPDNVGTFLSDRRIAVTAKNAILNQWLGPRWSLDWRLPTMTSVSHTALFTAIALGADPIILVGMDFALTSGKSHAKGSVFRYPATMADMIPVEGVRGWAVHSLPQLITDRKQIENAMATSTVRFIDTSLNGAVIGGAENRPLEEVRDTLLSSACDVSRIIDDIDWAGSVGNQAIVTEFEVMAEKVERFIHDCRAYSDTCRSELQKSEQNVLGRAILELVGQIRTILPDFDRKNGLLLSLLKLIRYGDVKEIASRLASLQSPLPSKDDHILNAEKELRIYADYFDSLDRAARQFKSALMSVLKFFRKEMALLQTIGNDTQAGDGLLNLSHLYKHHDLYWRAEVVLQKHLAGQPRDVAAWLELGRMFAQKGLWLLARTYSKQMMSLFSTEPSVEAFASEIERAIAKLRDGAAESLDKDAVDEARRMLSEYLSIVGNDPAAQPLLNRIDISDEKTSAQFRQPESLTLTEAQREELDEVIRESLGSGAVEKAVGILEGLAQANETNAWEARERIGDIRLSQGDLYAALWHFHKALEQAPESDALASKIHKTNQKIAQGTLDMEKTMSHDKDPGTKRLSESDTPASMYDDAQNKIQQEAYADAVHILEQLLERFPDYSLAHNDLGVLYFSQGDNEKSFIHYKEAARIEPDNPVFQKNLADFLYVVRGEVEPALMIYVDLLTNDPMDKETLLALGHICMDQSKFEDAEVFYQRIQEVDPFDTDAEKALAMLADRRASPVDHPLQNVSVENIDSVNVSADAGSQGFPSPVVTTEICADNRNHVVQIPEQEMFRVNSIFEGNEYSVLDKRRSNAEYTVFDVGANVGIYALSVNLQHPNCKVYCFEPSPATQVLLEANVGNFPGTVICKYGLSNQDIETPMNLHQYNTGQNSIHFSGSHYSGSEMVQVKDAGRQFDALGLSHLDILKIDTEGCEVEILESMGERLEKVDYIVAEYHSEKCRRAIDALLIRFHLFGAHSIIPGIGTVKYVHPSLI